MRAACRQHVAFKCMKAGRGSAALCGFEAPASAVALCPPRGRANRSLSVSPVITEI